MHFVGMEKLSLLDFEDKVSCVLFCKECNFRCPFCHNGLTVINSNEFISWETIIDYLSKRVGVLDAVVFTGGEVTLMPDLKDKIKQVKELGFLIKLDTNGTNPTVVKSLLDEKLIDYVAMDIKGAGNKYPIITDVKANYFEIVKKTYQLLLDYKIDFELRTTLVWEYHEVSDFYDIGQDFKDAPRYYLQKFVEREGCFKKGLHPVDEDTSKQMCDILKKYIKNVSLRGY